MRNTFIQGTLSIVFAVVVIIVVITAVITALRSIRGAGRPLAAENPVPSRIFGPARLVATPLEREVQKQWYALAQSPTKSVGTSGH